MGSSEYFQGYLGTDTLLSTSPSARLTAPVVYWAAAGPPRPPRSRLLLSSAWSTGTKPKLSQFKAVCWAASDGAEVGAYVNFCQLCYVWQEAPLAETLNISWE